MGEVGDQGRPSTPRSAPTRASAASTRSGRWRTRAARGAAFGGGARHFAARRPGAALEANKEGTVACSGRAGEGSRFMRMEQMVDALSHHLPLINETDQRCY
jgi:hypothetical protein